jgi:hypothetical protein
MGKRNNVTEIRPIPPEEFDQKAAQEAAEAEQKLAEETPEAPQEQQGIPFNVDELFAAYGATRFENEKLRMMLNQARGEISRLTLMLKARRK